MPREPGPNDAANAFFSDGPPDPAYPVVTPPDPVYPGQTRAPLARPLDEIATPAIWSRLAPPLERVLAQLWDELGLAPSARPTRWVAIHYGRIALNAHVWERVRARLLGETPDPGLVEPAQAIGARLADALERARARLRRGRLARRIEAAERARTPFLRRLAEIDPGELDAGELARGPLDLRAWSEVLLAGLGRRLSEPDQDEADPGLRGALAFEQRCTAELGQRLAVRGVLAAPGLAAYLTVAERIRAVLEGASHWSEIAAARQERVEQFAKLLLPRDFFGRPRPDPEKV
ncbi:MAG TPA: hypothetical protein VEI82_06625 [Myxococcota bacterium]|nr:hypothetical protein [Myxococcota bacterium]